MTNRSASSYLLPTDTFIRRHNAPDGAQRQAMLEAIGVSDIDTLIDQSVPSTIRVEKPIKIEVFGEEREWGERELLERLRQLASKNQIARSLIGLGYSDCIVPPVIQRNILENPGWYTQYTPYQAEISQGRLEALLNFQTMVADLTGMSLANSSLLDEATAAAEALSMCFALTKKKRNCFVLSDACHPQTIAVVKTRAEVLDIEVRVLDIASAVEQGSANFDECCGVLLQYPTTDGRVLDYQDLIAKVHESGAMVVVAADLLALTLLKPPGEFGADICVGSSQRFGVPLGYGGPHAAFLATREEFRRAVPGRIIGVSRDKRGKSAYRMAMQTREQHIRREKATSNICTAQVLLAIMAGMYGVYHGPAGLQAIAMRVHAFARVMAESLKQRGYTIESEVFFDTLRVGCSSGQAPALLAKAAEAGFNLRQMDDSTLCIALDEKCTAEELDRLLEVFGGGEVPAIANLADTIQVDVPEDFRRTSEFMTHPVFHAHRSEHEMLRYIYHLQSKDLSLTTSMISLGSCTMKLNATSEMLPVSWPEFGNLHPFAPAEQCQGYAELFSSLETWLSEITGFAAVSLQPNAGSQGEYAGLLAIRAFHRAKGQEQRKVCLIPVSAHGTNPASAVMVGMKVVVVACDDQGNIDVDDLKAKAEKHKDELAALMVTYPSTHGVFETKIREICSIVHDYGGRVYLDGANMNAQVGLCRPGDYGADVCHLNLHKTFCIPHGGGGPGMGPIGVTEELKPYLPTHPLVQMGGLGPDKGGVGPIAAAPWGSPSILPISWVYIALMGSHGLKDATEVAILNANYMASQLAPHYPVLFRGEQGRVAHEFILDLRPFKASAGIEAEDVAKRLMDFGFHAPTMSFPVAGTLMIEPTESESKAELDRFCDAMIAIRSEIADIEAGKSDRLDNPLKQAPHTAEEVIDGEWNHSYAREQAAFPLPWVRDHKFWPAVSRVDNVWGDRNLICTCPDISEYQSED